MAVVTVVSVVSVVVVEAVVPAAVTVAVIPAVPRAFASEAVDSCAIVRPLLYSACLAAAIA
ncbi:hypothetical protein D3C71_2123770 [compost metagenome]